ncbi:holin [Cumulibacter soli]|uniref:holin n=1 Tax=Cumulibacter soli TaxID=2546344 RepID=UPI001067FBDD|nr:holin [Cumulibacter soli]
MTTAAFWKATTERAVKTFAQALVALIVVGTSVLDQTWGEALGIAATAAIVSVLTSVGSGAMGGGPSATNTEQITGSD